MILSPISHPARHNEAKGGRKGLTTSHAHEDYFNLEIVCGSVRCPLCAQSLGSLKETAFMEGTRKRDNYMVIRD